MNKLLAGTLVSLGLTAAIASPVMAQTANPPRGDRRADAARSATATRAARIQDIRRTGRSAAREHKDGAEDHGCPAITMECVCGYAAQAGSRAK